MKPCYAISLHQPWATLIALGIKRFETRSWDAPVLAQGSDILIHAAQRKPDREVLQDRYIAAALPDCVDGWDEVLPLGCVVAIAYLRNCFEAEWGAINRRYDVSDVPFGDFRPGRRIWALDGIRRLATPYPMRGRQRMFWADLPEQSVVMSWQSEQWRAEENIQPLRIGDFAP